MNADWRLPRNAMLWMLAAQLLVLLPHISRIPLWLLCAYGLCVLWRYKVYSGAWSAPKILVKAFFLLAVFAGIYSSYGRFLGLEPMVSLLLAGFAFKLLESYSLRDCVRFIFIGYFTLATVFLFDQGLWISLYVLLSLLLLSASLLSLQLVDLPSRGLMPLNKTAVIFAQALPLTLLLFLLFPRLDPFWQIKLPSHHAKTGVGDVLSPGDISQLSKDSSLAFRANFTDELPPRSAMYWRGVVLSYFDGRAWHLGTFNKKANGHNTLEFPASNSEASGTYRYDYTIIQEPSYRPWLYSIAVASSDTPKILATSDYRLQAQDDIYERTAYQVQSHSHAVMDSHLSAAQYRKETLLNGNNNVRARQFAQQLHAASDSDESYIQAVLNYFSEQNFIYSLKPPLLGANNVDEFLFDSRIGFCGHYASSFTFLMRAAGIPARVIGGYQGGELNPLTGSVLVHQFDAHAWTEVWLPQKGWQRVDPTLQVAPDRIANSVQDLPATQSDFFDQANMSALKFKHIALLNKLRLRLDALDYHWANWVLQYKGEKQWSFINRWLGAISFSRIISLLAIVISPVLLWMLWQLYKNRRQQQIKPHDREYQKLCALMAKYYLQRADNEGPIDFARRVDLSENIENVKVKQHFLSATRLYVALAYVPQGSDNTVLLQRQLQVEVRVLRKLFG
ncbi:DUF3488 and transglutaminase-like domain-containing protein [Dasania marina]|uniref:transglutaminase family protein n=1 Tax=Dasania marina TaxID=471499 RepID=UPI0030DA3DD2|tara:strand:- start:2133 stop:4160 length:2028 start_codon:yes stop_codon:yes gene_type:complete